MLPALVYMQSWWFQLWDRRDERGQTSAEYALVLLGAAAVAVLVGVWATKTNRISKLFDTVLDAVLGKIT